VSLGRTGDEPRWLTNEGKFSLACVWALAGAFSLLPSGVTPVTSAPGVLMRPERKQGYHAEPVPVSAYAGSSNNRKHLISSESKMAGVAALCLLLWFLLEVGVTLLQASLRSPFTSDASRPTCRGRGCGELSRLGTAHQRNVPRNMAPSRHLSLMERTGLVLVGRERGSGRPLGRARWLS